MAVIDFGWGSVPKALVRTTVVVEANVASQTLLVFAREWEFNAAFFGLLKPWLPNPVARALCGLLLTIALAGYYLVFRRMASGTVVRGDWIYGGVLALWPVVNPWYLLWLLPFAAIRPSAWAWTASVAVLLSYVTGLNLNNMDMHPFGHPSWVLPLEYGLILLALAYDIFTRIRRSGRVLVRACVHSGVRRPA